MLEIILLHHDSVCRSQKVLKGSGYSPDSLRSTVLLTGLIWCCFNWFWYSASPQPCKCTTLLFSAFVLFSLFLDVPLPTSESCILQQEKWLSGRHCFPSSGELGEVFQHTYTNHKSLYTSVRQLEWIPLMTIPPILGLKVWGIACWAT